MSLAPVFSLSACFAPTNSLGRRLLSVLEDLLSPLGVATGHGLPLDFLFDVIATTIMAEEHTGTYLLSYSRSSLPTTELWSVALAGASASSSIDSLCLIRQIRLLPSFCLLASSGRKLILPDD